MRHSGGMAEGGRVQVGEEERVVGTVIGCMAGTDKQRVVVEVAAVSTAHTRLCPASYSARMGRTRQAVVAGDGRWCCYGRGRSHTVQAVVDKLVVAWVELLQGRVAGTVGRGCMRLVVAGIAPPWLASREGSLDSDSDDGMRSTSTQCECSCR